MPFALLLGSFAFSGYSATPQVFDTELSCSGNYKAVKRTIYYRTAVINSYKRTVSSFPDTSIVLIHASNVIHVRFGQITRLFHSFKSKFCFYLSPSFISDPVFS
jgi:hypothetical protein